MRIAIYYAHHESLGHSVRVKNLIAILKKEGADVLVIQAGKPQQFLEYGCRVENVPFSISGREIFHGARKHMTAAEVRQRVHFIKNTLQRFNPDVFITEYFPFGRELFSLEITTIIQYLKSVNPRIKIYASVGYPILENRRVVEAAQLYDKILIHCPKDMDLDYIRKATKLIGREDLLHLYTEIFDKLKEKAVFTNYVIAKHAPSASAEEIKKNLGIDEKKKLVLASRGGGVTNPKTIATAIRSASFLADDVSVLVVYGVSSSAREEKLFSELARRHDAVKLLKFHDKFTDVLSASDVSVSMSGYNTSLEVMWMRKKAIFVPRAVDVGKARMEQFYRAIMLQDKIGSAVLYYDELTPRLLADTISRKLAEPAPQTVDASWFNSEKIIARECLE